MSNPQTTPVSIDVATRIIQAHAEGRTEGRNAAFADMLKHANAVMLGAEDRPASVYDLFMKAIQAAAAGELPKRPSLSFAERRAIARNFISKHGDRLFDDNEDES